MGPWNDVDITGVLSGMLIGIIAAFLSMEDKRSRKNGGRLIPIGGGLLLGLLAGLLAVWLTGPLDGCSLIKAKDSSFYLVWGTDGVLVRTVTLCGLVGSVLGTLTQGVRALRAGAGCGADGSRSATSPMTDGPSEGSPGVKRAPPEQTVPEGSGKVWYAALAGAFWGFLGGALVIGLPATFILTMARAMRGLP